MKIVEIEIPDGKKAVWENGVLTLVDDVQKPVTERIKTFEDACAALTDNDQFVLQYNVLKPFADNALLAFLKLRIICKALNEGWQPVIGNGEKRYVPRFSFTTKAVYDRLADDEKEKRSIISAERYQCDYHAVYCYLAEAYVETAVGCCQLQLKTGSLAMYCGTQFIEIWKDLLLTPAKDAPMQRTPSGADAITSSIPGTEITWLDARKEINNEEGVQYVYGHEERE